MTNQNKEQFIKRMSKLYDNYNKVVAELGEERVNCAGWYVAHKQKDFNFIYFDKAWEEFVKATINLTDMEFRDLVNLIADNKQKVNEFISNFIR